MKVSFVSEPVRKTLLKFVRVQLIRNINTKVKMALFVEGEKGTSFCSCWLLLPPYYQHSRFRGVHSHKGVWEKEKSSYLLLVKSKPFFHFFLSKQHFWKFLWNQFCDFWLTIVSEGRKMNTAKFLRFFAVVTPLLIFPSRSWLGKFSPGMRGTKSVRWRGILAKNATLEVEG